MPENVPDADALGYVSLELTARVAGVTLAEVQRIVADFAKGRPRELWFGARLQVRTENVLGRRHRDIAVSSLPDYVREALTTNRFRFLLAAEQAMPGAELGPADFTSLHRAGQSEAVDPDFFGQNVSFLCNDASLASAPRERFDLVMDNFYGWGFRDHALPGVSPDYLDFLDRSRRYLGMSDRYYSCVLAELAGVDLPRHIDGAGFLRVGNFLLQLGLPWTLPPREYMNRETIGVLNESCYQLGISYDRHSMEVTVIGGGAIRPRDLDMAGWLRVRASRLKAGYRKLEPAPQVPGDPGFISQPQANLMWRLYCDRTERPSLADLDRHCGGSVAGLTQAGARSILDELLALAFRNRLCENMQRVAL